MKISNSEIEEYIKSQPTNGSVPIVHIALSAIHELVKSKNADFLFLMDDQVREFWNWHMDEILRRKKIRDALQKLSKEEKELLRIKSADYDIQ